MSKIITIIIGVTMVVAPAQAELGAAKHAALKAAGEAMVSSVATKWKAYRKGADMDVCNRVSAQHDVCWEQWAEQQKAAM